MEVPVATMHAPRSTAAADSQPMIATLSQTKQKLKLVLILLDCIITQEGNLYMHSLQYELEIIVQGHMFMYILKDFDLVNSN